MGDLLVIADRCYNWANIFAEYLGISPSEYNVYTDSDKHSRWFELYGYLTEGEALCPGGKDCPHLGPDGKGKHDMPGLRIARTLARRLGVSYKELTEIVQSNFVNPELEKVAILWKLHINVIDVVRYFNNKTKPEYEAEKKAFEDKLKEFDARYKLSADYSLSELEKRWTEGTSKNTLVLRDSSILCNFDKTYLEFAIPGSSTQEKADQEVKLKLYLLKISPPVEKARLDY